MRALPLLALLVPSVALANGGPVAWTLPSGAGGLAPVGETRVALVSEQLSIRLEDDAQHFQVRAEYVLANEGPAVKVKYGVPLFWYPSNPDVEPGADIEALGGAGAREYAKTVTVVLAGSRSPCALEDVRPVEAQVPEKGVVGWCTADLVIPTGARIPLVLSYRGTLRFVDMEYSKSVFTVFGERKFRYDLSPAGSWSGRPNLSVAIDPGIWGDRFAVNRPDGFVSKGGEFVLEDAAADLKALDAVIGKLDAAPALRFRQRAKAKAAPGLQARASSTLAPQGKASYAAKNLLDGDPATAWCAAHGAMGPHWIELRGRAPDHCWLEYVLIPGYAKSQQAWLANNRLRRVHLGGCGGPEAPSVAIGVPPFRYEEAAFDLEARDLGVNRAIEEAGCVRLVIDEVDPGPDGDTCISEFKGIASCG